MRDEQKDLKILADAFFAELYISDVEYGGIGLDPKRPFGNSDVERDMLELLDMAQEGDDGDGPCFSSGQRQYVRTLYHEKLIPYLRRRWHELAPGVMWFFRRKRIDANAVVAWFLRQDENKREALLVVLHEIQRSKEYEISLRHLLMDPDVLT